MTALRASMAHGGGVVERKAVFVDEVHDHLEGLTESATLSTTRDALAIHRGDVHERGSSMGSSRVARCRSKNRRLAVPMALTSIA